MHDMCIDWTDKTSIEDHISTNTHISIDFERVVLFFCLAVQWVNWFHERVHVASTQNAGPCDQLNEVIYLQIKTNWIIIDVLKH